MKINSRLYHGLLGSLRKHVFPEFSLEEMKREIKKLDPEFPEKNNEYISIKDLTKKEGQDHMRFVKNMIIVNNVPSNHIEKFDILMKQDSYPVRFKDNGDGNFDVTCSICGCITPRVLTKERQKELKRVSSGAVLESNLRFSETFYCSICFGRISDWMYEEYKRENHSGI